MQAENIKDFTKGKREFKSIITKHYASSTNLIHEELIVKTSLGFPEHRMPSSFG